MPYCGYFDTDTDTIEILERTLADSSSGIEDPAAFVVETVQAEGGVNVASREWLRRLATVAKEVGALLIVDDIQVGCGRTGPFFSFEPAGISPDIVCLSKSLSGYGLPLAITLMRPELDQWSPGEHNGTFRGHNPAFVTAAAALETYWATNELTKKVNHDAACVRDVMFSLADDYEADVRGRGLIQGIEFEDKSLACEISREAFERGLIMETAGPCDEVLKALPPLTTDEEGLQRGLEIMEESARVVLSRAGAAVPSGMSSSENT
jgi:diaminobutyrate-2-oxoglutarate transaminase